MYSDWGSGFLVNQSAGELVHYGPFFNITLETGANPSCDRTEASVTVIDCGPTEIKVISPITESNWENHKNVDFNVTSSVSVNNVISGKEITVFPSPATDQFNVTFEMNGSHDLKILIINSIGAIIKTQNLLNVTEIKT